MEKEFVPYQPSLDLKELGFDEPCFGWYNWTGKDLSLTNNSYVDINPTPAPLYQQAFRWFREKYKISGEISSDYYLEGKDNEWEYNIYQLGKEDDGYVGTIPIFKTPEEAELECLKKLIEIVKETKL